MLWVLVLLASLGIILLAAELFTNSVEWVGYHLRLGEGAVGSILAAVGTALPETLIPVVAILFFGDAAANEVGIGAILGAPFMLSTLAMFVVGVAVLAFARTGRRGGEVNANAVVLSRDITFFLGAYTLAVLAGFTTLPWLKVLIAVGLVLTYAVYVYLQFTRAAEQGEEPNPLHATVWLPRGHSRIAGRPLESIIHLYFNEYEIVEQGDATALDDGDHLLAEDVPAIDLLERQVPRFAICIGQALFALGLIVLGAHFFVQAIEQVSSGLGIPALVLALIVAPVATELPEKFNSVLWVRVGKDTLAMGNISGAMVFQSCIPTAIGIAFTHWAIGESPAALASAIIALVSAALIFGVSRARNVLSAGVLLMGALFYAAYLAFIILIVV